MTDAGEYARVTPYEISIPGRAFAEEEFPRLEEEAESRGVDLRDPGAFVLLQATGELLEKLRIGGEDPELLHQYGAVIFHSYHFWKAGEPFYLLERAVARFLVEGEPAPEGWTPAVPHPAGYLQLPRHLFWSDSEAEEEEPAEPLDGLFWSVGPGESLSVLVAMGMRDDRAGLSAAALPPLPLGDAEHWLHEKARKEGEDFRTTLPGGELDNLYSVVSTGEVLKLAARAFWYLDHFPGAVGEEERAPGSESGPTPSTLPFRRARLKEEGE